MHDKKKFLHEYELVGIKVDGIDSIKIRIVGGKSSFFDFLVYEGDLPTPKMEPLMAIEETKTTDEQSRNTGVYQRGSKFVFIRHYYKNTQLYMLYSVKGNKRPTDTNVFGTKLLLTLGVKFLGKDVSLLSGFKSVDDVIDAKNRMNSPNLRCTPIKISREKECVKISGMLSKPPKAGNIGHDPNIGALSLISAGLRKLGYNKRIIITQHGVKASYLKKINRGNKFLYNSRILGVELEGVNKPNVQMPSLYWEYEKTGEKLATLYLHLSALVGGMKTVYENHAGCERGDFSIHSSTGKTTSITIPKRNSHDIKINLPDLVLCSDTLDYVIIIEGECVKNINSGLTQLKQFNIFKNEYVSRYYPCAKQESWIVLYGDVDDISTIDRRVLLLLTTTGVVYLNKDAPSIIKKLFSNVPTQIF